MTDTTNMLARIIGPLLFVVGLAVALRHNAFADIIQGFASDPTQALVWGFLALLAGLIILAFHHRWDGVLAGVITAIGWLSIIRGVLLLLVPDATIAFAQSAIGASSYLPVILGLVAAALGAWIGFMGYRPRAVV